MPTPSKLTKAQIEQNEIKAERDFLLRRVKVANDHGNLDEIGASSNAMVISAMDISASIHEFFYPRDPSDLRRCENTYHAAPDHLQKKMLPILQSFRCKVAERYPEVGCG